MNSIKEPSLRAILLEQEYVCIKIKPLVNLLSISCLSMQCAPAKLMQCAPAKLWGKCLIFMRAGGCLSHFNEGMRVLISF